MTLGKKTFGRIVGGKREKNAGNKHFLSSNNVFRRQRTTAQLQYLPNDKVLNRSKLKAFADDKINVNEVLKISFGRVENIVGRGENAGYQHFLLFPQCFRKPSVSRSLKVGTVWQRINQP